MIHPSDEEALQTIDAAVFTGDPDEIRERLTYFMERWQKALTDLDEGPKCVRGSPGCVVKEWHAGCYIPQ